MPMTNLQPIVDLLLLLLLLLVVFPKTNRRVMIEVVALIYYSGYLEELQVSKEIYLY
jgi:hypothetical protein